MQCKASPEVGRSGLLPVFVNKVLLAHSRKQWLMHHLWLLLPEHRQVWVVGTETLGPAKLKIFTIWPFLEKVADPL